MNKQDVIIIVAMTDERVIGKDNDLPWHISEDLKHFKKQTLDQTVIMGHNTYLSLGKPLPRRNNIVISPSLEDQTDLQVFSDLDSALEFAQELGKKIFIIGGAYTYKNAIDQADYLYISHVKKRYDGNVYFPIFDVEFWTKKEEYDFDEFTFVIYKRK